jgi:hypothetical protein
MKVILQPNRRLIVAGMGVMFKEKGGVGLFRF